MKMNSKKADSTASKKTAARLANVARIRLRFDRVATRLVERLHASLADTVPDGVTVLLTITAPIHLPSKTAVALDEKIRTLLERGSPAPDKTLSIHMNRVLIRLVKHESRRAPKVMGFVHNPDSDPLLLLNLAREYVEASG